MWGRHGFDVLGFKSVKRVAELELPKKSGKNLNANNYQSPVAA